MNAKKIITIVLRIAGVAGIAALVWTWNVYGSFVMAANSVKRLNDHFYYMEFKGDIQLEEYLKSGGAASNSQMAEAIEALLRGKRINKVFKEEVPLDTGCASMAVQSPEGKQLFGRNYDWDDLKAAMIIKSTPKHGYKSISTVQLDFLGFGEDFKPDTFGHKYLSTAALFVPLDGMNEKGLCVSDLMAGDEEFTNQDTGKSNVTTTLAIRGLLDFCADVPQAIDFLKNHDMHSVIGKAHHFAISDAQGRMVVAEYVNNELIITETNAVTNHYLGVEKDLSERQNSVLRLGILQQYLFGKAQLTEKEVKQALQDICASQYDSYSKTWWRVIYNKTDLTVNYALEEKYNENDGYDFKL